MGMETIQADTVAEAYLNVLSDRGVDYLFGNAGTDFPSIIEGLAKGVAGSNIKAPVPITVPHETVAVAMAHGYYLATGKPQAVMLHVNVGAANGLCGIMNASRDNIPIIFTSGRTPITEKGMAGSRNLFIHWGQEMFDQAGMMREMVKWDYELRVPEQIETVVDRAMALSMSEPRGPVYLTLPREVLAQKVGDFSFSSPSRMPPARPPAPDADGIAQAAEMIAKAENPVIITASFGRDLAAVKTLGDMSEQFALPIIGFHSRYLPVPQTHPFFMGAMPMPWIKDADVIVVLDCDVPWIPSLHSPNPDAKVIQIGSDPLFAQYPVRGFPTDVALTGSTSLAVPMLADALSTHAKSAASRIDARRKKLGERKKAMGENMKAAREKAATQRPLSPVHVAACIGNVRNPGDIVVNESTLPMFHAQFDEPGTFLGGSPAGGLGWGMGAALGVKLAVGKDKMVINIEGDGSYMFSAPTAAHFVSAANNLPILTIIHNNGIWGSVRRGTLGSYPEGQAARMNQAPLTYLEPKPEYHKIVEACGGYGEKVEDPDELPKALERAAAVVREEGRQAVLNVVTGFDDAEAAAAMRPAN